MANAPQSQPQVQDGDLRSSRHQADYSFFKGFFQREEIAAQQVRGLQEHVGQLCAAVQHAGRESQKDRQALNKSQDQKKALEKHLREVEEGFRLSESARARIENELQDEWQEHRLCLENLKYECNRHSQTEKNLERIWASHNHLEQIMADIKCRADDGLQDITYNVTNLVMELSEKSQKVEDLENKGREDSHRWLTEFDSLKEHLRDESAAHTSEFMAQAQRIKELELLLQREQMKPRVEIEPQQGPKRGRRYRGKGRGSKGTSSIDSTTNQSNIGHVEAQDYVSFGGLPGPQSYQSVEEEHAPINQGSVWRREWQEQPDDRQMYGPRSHSSGGLATVEEESV